MLLGLNVVVGIVGVTSDVVCAESTDEDESSAVMLLPVPRHAPSGIPAASPETEHLNLHVDIFCYDSTCMRVYTQ